MNLKNVFNSIYMVNQIRKISEKNRSNFAIFNDLPLDLKLRICECCLCRAIRNVNIPNDLFCILNDSLGRDCFKNEVECYAKNQLKSNSLCANCVQVVSFISSEKNQLTKLFQCCFPSCAFKSKRSFNMKRHYLIHLHVKDNKCAICEQHFARKFELQEHQRTCS